MPTLSAAELQTLHDRCQQTDLINLTDAQRFDALHRPSSRANPAARGSVNVPFDAADLVADLSPASLSNVTAIPSFDGSILPLLNAPEPKTPDTLTKLNQWAGMLAKAGKLTQAEFDALAAPAPGTTPGAAPGVFNRTQPDPAYGATVPGPSIVAQLYGPGKTWAQADGAAVNFVPFVDVQAAR